MLEIGYTMHP